VLNSSKSNGHEWVILIDYLIDNTYIFIFP
jgi:hypothetical protein